MDLISRQAAIDAVLHHGEIENNYTDLYHDGYCDGVYDSADMLKDLPTVEPKTGEWKTGKWLKAYGDHEAFGVRPFYRYCSACNESTVFPYNYCPNCGARMEGGEE